MARSIFDPTGGETERSGSANLGPAANNSSQMPSDVVDGKAEDDAERGSMAQIDAAHADLNEVAATEEEAVERLKQMQEMKETPPEEPA